MNNRILVVGEYGSLNGGENSFLSVLPTLQMLGWEFQAAVPTDSDFANALKSCGLAIHDFAITDSSGIRNSQDKIRETLSAIIKRAQPRIVHCNSLSTSRLCGPVTHELGIPSLGYLRDIMKLSKKAIADINQIDRLIAVSNATRDWHVSQGFNADKTTVVYNGVDSKRFAPAEHSKDADNPRSELNIPAGAPILLFVGQIGIRKAVDVLLDSFLDLSQRMATETPSTPPPHLVIVGKRHSQKQESIDYENRLLEQSQRSEFADRIHWVGLRSDIPELMRAATILVHPARQEPLGRVLLEAASSGLPIVTTSVGGSPEILDDAELADLLIPPNDPAQLTEVLFQLLTRVDSHTALGQIGKRLLEIALRKFSNAQSAESLARHYRELIGR